MSLLRKVLGRKTEDPLDPPASDLGFCLASNRVVVEGMGVGLMYRERPARPGDSGWRFLSGSEPDAYMDDPENHSVRSVGAICELDPSVAPLVGSAVGSAYGHRANHLPLQPAYRTFYQDVLAGTALGNEDAEYDDRENILVRMARVLREKESFFGLIDACDSTLQFYVDAPDSVRAEIPAPEKRGSHGTTLTLKACLGLVEVLEGPITLAAYPTFRFERW